VGLGTWLAKPGEVEAAVFAAIEAGYRHIDCAYGYGNEKQVGEGIKQAVDKGIAKREDLFIVSKLWNTRHNVEDVKPSVKESLTLLGLEYLDLYLIHWPHSFKAGPEMFPRDADGNILYGDTHYLETWKALEECVDEGLIRSIGVSNFNSEQIQEILDKGRIKPAVQQIEVNVYFQQEKLVSFCQTRGVVVTAYSCFGSPGRPWGDKAAPLLIDNPVLVEIGRRHNKSSAQIVLRWLLQRGITVLPKSITKSRIVENFQVFDFELAAEDLAQIKALDINKRCLAPTVERDGKVVFRDEKAPFFPFHIEF